MDLKFDQHYLEDDILIREVVEQCNIKPSDIIFEIGPGKGNLTRTLLEKTSTKLICVEKDENLKSFLTLEIMENNNFEYIQGDGLEELGKHLITKLISNIPYSITEPLYTKILDLKIPFCMILHGKDFYRNITERETKWKYFVPAFFNIELIREVQGDVFNPPAKVKSVFVKLTLKKILSQRDVFYQELWNKRKRTTENAIIFALVDAYTLTKSEAEEKVNTILHLREKIKLKPLENLSNIEFTDIIEKLGI